MRMLLLLMLLTGIFSRIVPQTPPPAELVQLIDLNSTTGIIVQAPDSAPDGDNAIVTVEYWDRHTMPVSEHYPEGMPLYRSKDFVATGWKAPELVGEVPCALADVVQVRVRIIKTVWEGTKKFRFSPKDVYDPKNCTPGLVCGQ